METLTTERQERAEAPAAPQPSGRTQAEAEAYKGPAPKQPTLFGSDAEYGDQAPDNTYERPTMPPGGVSKRMPGQGTLFGTSLPKGRASKGRQLQPDIPYPTSGSRVVRTAPRPEPPSERLGDLEDVHAASAGMPDVDLTSGSSGAPATQIPESQAATARTPEEHITRLVGAGLTNTTNVPVSDTDVNAYAEQNKPLIATASRRAAQRARQRNRPTGGQ